MWRYPQSGAFHRQRVRVAVSCKGGSSGARFLSVLLNGGGRPRFKFSRWCIDARLELRSICRRARPPKHGGNLKIAEVGPQERLREAEAPVADVLVPLVVEQCFLAPKSSSHERIMQRTVEEHPNVLQPVVSSQCLLFDWKTSLCHAVVNLDVSRCADVFLVPRFLFRQNGALSAVLFPLLILMRESLGLCSLST